jgi:hypothetical protein
MPRPKQTPKAESEKQNESLIYFFYSFVPPTFTTTKTEPFISPTLVEQDIKITQENKHPALKSIISSVFNCH